MKILILGFTKLKFMPYLRFYAEGALDSNENHILYWNRDLEEEATEEFSGFILHEFRCFQKDEISKISKIKSFTKYRKFAIKTINELKPDKIIVMHTLPAVLIEDVLCKKYKQKFILDYRDFTYENIKFFKNKVAKLAENAYLTFVSSAAYRKFLPNLENIYTIHNLSEKLLENRKTPEIYSHTPIRLSFWGYIRQEEINRALIERIGNNKNFELHYYGREQETAEKLKAFVKTKKFSNIYFHGEYKPEDRYKFAENTDILDNIYYDQNSLMAMGNKFYDGLAFRLPQVFMTGSFMGELGNKSGVGTELDPRNPDFCEKLKSWYESLNRPDFNKNCDNLLAEIKDEYDIAKNYLTMFGEKC